ncbi:TonB family protein [Phyllobacterium sp. 21LDTY02-6]|uniref:energy transducer TonB family protein n=1 Tax=Phyllobacterium sp. 21LDTY02-6 TaxID=2944903 RepID=UPI002021AF44|nr:TonB family protein [Phyllobacterium sp. 21LDTY02-6]MCO4319451.1 TonB family protein [Phyllobacterium sp. 21LDTY02-6]
MRRAGPFAFSGTDWREIGRWSAAGVVVAGLHVGAALAIQQADIDEAAGDIQAPIIIDMEPMPAPIVAKPVEEIAEPVEPEEVAEQEVTPPEEIEPEPEEQVEPVEQAALEPEPDVEPLPEQAEELVELPKVEVPLPVVRPEPEKPEPQKKPAEKKIVKKVEKRVEKKIEIAKVEAPKAAQPPKRAASSAAAERQAAKWGDRISSYLRRKARRARADGSGTVTVRFVVTRDGSIVATSVVGSSGSSQLDQSVLNTVRNASPVPSAPDEVSVARQSFTVPFRIN